MKNKGLYETRQESMKYWHPLSKIKYPASLKELLPQDSNHRVKKHPVSQIMLNETFPTVFGLLTFAESLTKCCSSFPLGLHMLRLSPTMFI